MTKSINRQQKIFYAQGVCSRVAKEDTEAFKANAIINVQQLVKIITTVIETNRKEFDFIDQWLTSLLNG